ncbi:MAG: hypothetical protein QNL12_05325 [Acidimicrobiia bacterium]|nr:hypothetical protein [Acidimicrobiia bacterium]MDX2466713.1 hypothetical protein [Acidimicrobiia bacterium]
MMRWPRRRRPTRSELIDRKHQLEGEIRALAADVKRSRNRGAPVDELEARLATMRHQHHQIRLRIDRTK